MEAKEGNTFSAKIPHTPGPVRASLLFHHHTKVAEKTYDFLHFARQKRLSLLDMSERLKTNN